MWEILEHITFWKWFGFPLFIWIPFPSTSLEIFHQGAHVIWMKSYGMCVKGIHDKDLIFHLETSEKTLLLQGCELEIIAVVNMCSVTQLCPSCNPMVCSPPSSSVHGIFQARILESVAIYSSKGSSWTRDWTHISCFSLHWQADSLLLSHLGSPVYPKARGNILQTPYVLLMFLRTRKKLLNFLISYFFTLSSLVNKCLIFWWSLILGSVSVVTVWEMVFLMVSVLLVFYTLCQPLVSQTLTFTYPVKGKGVVFTYCSLHLKKFSILPSTLSKPNHTCSVSESCQC